MSAAFIRLAPFMLYYRGMNVGIYQGAAAMASTQRWQEVISQNIASSSVPGYRATQLSVEGLNFGTISGGKKSNTQAAVMPTESTSVSFERGSMSRTANPTDVAIGGDGFFSVQEANGKVRYTRNGEFGISSSNQLISSTGEPVIGEGGPISLSPSGGELTFDAGGQVYQGNTLVGKLKVVNFADTSSLVKVSGGFYSDAEATTVASPNITQGYLEGSNVSGISEMVKLIQVSRSQEANQKVISAYDDRLSRVITTFTRQ